MITFLATVLFTTMMATALLSLAWDMTRPLLDLDMHDAKFRARAEARRIAALPRAARGIGRAGPSAIVRLPIAATAPGIRRPSSPALAFAA